MSRAACLLLALAVAWLPAPTGQQQLEIVLEWLVKDGVSTDAAVAALRDPAALQSAMVQAAVAALQAAGLTNITNRSLALELRNMSGSMVSPTPAPAAGGSARALPAGAGGDVWLVATVVGAAALVCLGAAVTLWVWRPEWQRPARPVLPHRIRV